MKKLFIIILFLLLRFCCFSQTIDTSFKNNDKKIVNVIYNNGGNEMGYDKLMVSADSISYGKYSEKNTYYNKVPNTQINWIKLINAINLEKFDKIKSGENEREVDGLDTQIIIETSEKKHMLIVNKDNYTQIKELLTQLRTNLKKVYSDGSLEY